MNPYMHDINPMTPQPTIEEVLDKYRAHDSDAVKRAMTEYSQLTSAPLIKEIERLKKEVDDCKRHIAEIVYQSEQPGGYHP